MTTRTGQTHRRTAAELSIALTPTERAICAAVASAAATFPAVAVEARVAGGWVRDKLLRLASHDLDFAVSNTTGHAFALHLAAHMQAMGQETHSVAKIASNPDRSKHLETATTWILGTPVDFVGLRCDVYTDASRVPEVRTGTAKEDAFRRDMTINALFYNVSTGEVEDHTCMGLQDLADGVVRTPLPPRETFLDDPLRVLRLVRFSSRFAFPIVPQALAAMHDAEVKDAFRGKVSRERVGVEVGKMMAGADPVGALRVLVDVGWSPLVFGGLQLHQEDDSVAPIDYHEDVQVAYAIQELVSVAGDLATDKFGIRPADYRGLYLAAAYHHARGHSVKVKSKLLPLAFVMVRDFLKLSNVDAERTMHLLADIQFLHGLLDDFDRHRLDELDRVRMGKVVRRLAHQVGIGEHWRICFFFAAAVDLALEFGDREFMRADAERVLRKYIAVMDHIQALGVDQCHVWKYIVDGKEVASLLGLRPGPRIKEVLEDSVMAWQLANPSGSVDECRSYLLASIRR